MFGKKLSKKMIAILVVMMFALSIASTYALTINSLPTTKNGIYSQKVEDSALQILSFTHKMNPHGVKSSMELYNPSTVTINAEVTVYYQPDLAEYTFNVTINPSQHYYKTFSVSLDVGLIEDIEISIDEF